MSYLLIAVGVITLGVVLIDTFQTIIMPRTITSAVRLTRIFYVVLSAVWSVLLKIVHVPRIRTNFMAGFAPFSLLALFVFWAVGLILGFACIHLGLHTPFGSNGHIYSAGFSTNLYFSGVTFLTLGFGDVAPIGPTGRALAVLEAGVGFGFLAVVISYLPVMYTAFSKRETLITLLDARAGSPPTAGIMMKRYAEADNMTELTELLATMERWSAELLEAYLSYPILAWYRSQHDDESWLATITAILDACALISLEFDGEFQWEKKLQWQAYLTFAMSRHALVDLSQIIFVPPVEPPEDRLSPETWKRLCTMLAEAGTPICDREDTRLKLAEIRKQYEPYIYGLSKRLYLTMPPWIPETETKDNWETSTWDSKTHL